MRDIVRLPYNYFMNSHLKTTVVLLALITFALSQATDCNSGISPNDRIQTGNSIFIQEKLML